MYKHQLLDFGEMSRQDAYEACWAFLHDLSIDQSLVESDPLIQTLAVIDHRLGKRRLGTVNQESLHPLARKLLHVRLAAEGLSAAV